MRVIANWATSGPPGSRSSYERLLNHHGYTMTAQHDIMDCGAEMIWQAQHKGGSTFPIEVGMASFTEEGQVLTQTTVVDMTGWKISIIG